MVVHLKNLNEHAIKKADFNNKLWCKIDNILENSILIIQCRYDKSQVYRQNINHWKVELRAACNTCAELRLKRNNSYDKRLSYIRAEWIEGLEIFSDLKKIKRISKESSEKEHTEIVINQEFLKILETLINRLIELIAQGDTDIIAEYIDKL